MLARLGPSSVSMAAGLKRLTARFGSNQSISQQISVHPARIWAAHGVNPADQAAHRTARKETKPHEHMVRR
jgi:hypothetical protein